MTLTDEELRDLISTRFGGAALGVDLDSVQRRGRQRRRRARIAVAAVIAGIIVAVITYKLLRS